MKINKFRLTIAGNISLSLNKKNYSSVLQNTGLINFVSQTLRRMEVNNINSLLVGNTGYSFGSIQIDRLVPAKEIE